MKAYRVRLWLPDQDGREEYIEFDAISQAIECYDGLGGQAEIQVYDAGRHCYEVILFPTFEF